MSFPKFGFCSGGKNGSGEMIFFCTEKNCVKIQKMIGKRGNCEKVGIWAKFGEFGVKRRISRRLVIVLAFRYPLTD